MTTHGEGEFGMQVWVLSKGQIQEGGNVLGIYADKDTALGPFIKAANEIHDMFEIDDAHQAVDGSVHLTGGCDWLSLEPHEVISHVQIATTR
jgi:hypothetical protein